MKRLGLIVGTAVLFCFVGTTPPADAQQDQQDENQANPQEQAKPEKQKGQTQSEQQRKAKQKEQQRQRAQQQKEQSQQQKEQQRQLRVQTQQKQNQQQAEQRQQQQAQQQKEQEQNQQKKEQQQQQRVQQQKQQERLSRERQQQLIAQQQQRIAQYRQRLDQQQQQMQAAQERTALLQQQNRASQYRFQAEYLERLRQQQIRIRNDRDHDYDRDPYFYTAPIYRYQRGGSYYETNQYGADLLRQAVNYGYEQGFRAGEADQRDRWRSNYNDSYAYQDANYGYTGYYVDQDQYNYYFREGFRRGYEDGYGSRYQYGRYSNGSYSVLDAILGQILGFQPLGDSSRDSGQYTILSAQYGTARRHVDVTNRLKELARQDRLFRMGNSTFGIDPDPGYEKTLRIYARGPYGQQRMFEYREGSTVDGSQFLSWGSGEWGNEPWSGPWEAQERR